MPYEPFLGEIMYVAGSFAPRGWAACNGQLLQIQQYQALFALLGTAFGGNGVQTFGLPDLRGRASIGTQPNGQLGAMSGSETYSLQTNEIPSHTHTLSATTTAGNSPIPTTNAALGTSSGQDSDGNSFAVSMYSPSLASPANAAGAMISNTGSGQGHENRQPYQVVTACIALQGIFPSRS